MKKLLCLVLALVMVLGTMPVFAETTELGAAMDTDYYNVYVSGKTDMMSKPVSLVLVKDNGEVGHVEEIKTDKDGNYETKFRFNKPIGDYSILVRDAETAQDLTSTVKTAFARHELYSLDLNISNSGNDVIGYISEKDALNVAVSINNKYGNATSVNVIFASYGENKALLDTKIKTLNVGFNDMNVEKNVDFTDFALPEGTKYVKAFVWEIDVNLIPLAEEDVKEKRDDVAFTNENPENTKVIGIVGDSITAHGNYVFFLNQYYASKYPESNIVILNKGISGDSAKGILGRLDWDLFNEKDALGYGACDEITVMIGMNDVGYNGFNKGPQEDYAAAFPDKPNTINTIVGRIETIVQECQERNVPITLITPSLYDESDRFTNTLSGGTKHGTNWALGEVAKGVLALGEKYDVPVLDLYKASNEYSDRIRANNPSAKTVITGTDGIHPNENGGYLFGYLYARAQETNPTVGAVEIDASNGSAEAENATVSSVNASASEVTYTYKPNSLPLANVAKYKYVKNYGVDIENHMNREIIKVSNLEKGTYTITMNGAEIGSYSAKELAEGVNVAEIANNPNQQVAVTLDTAVTKKYTNEKPLRSNVLVEQRIRNGYGADYRDPGMNLDFDSFTTQDWIDYATTLRNNYEKSTPEAEWSNDQPVYNIKGYLTRKPNTETNIAGTKEAIEEIRNIRPVECEVIITKTGEDYSSDGEDVLRVAFIGDSITHGTQYLKGIEHYYQTRHPDKEIVFVNKGISGNYASSVINRFDWDITEDEISGKIDEATLMIGMNDVTRDYYLETSTATQEQKDKKITTCVENVEKIIKLCENNGIKLTIITPSAFDDTEGFATSTANAPGCNTYGLKNISDKLKVLAANYNIPVIDLWTPTTDVTNYIRSTFGYDGIVIAGNDRIHPGEQGGTYMAYQFIKQKDNNPIVASVEINAANGSKNVENANVTVTNATNSRVEYKYLPKAIPFAYTSYYKLFEETWGVPITNDINQEIIKVTGLSEGTYKITIGSNTLSVNYSASELAEGVNIAIDVNNPAQIQAKAAYEKARTKVANEGTYRSIAITEQQIKARPDVDTSKFNKDSTNDELKALGAWPGNFRNYFTDDASNFGSKKYEVENWAKLRTQEQVAREASRPVLRTVVIEKQ